MAYQTNLFINNEFVKSSSGETLTVRNPSNDDVVTDNVQVASEQDVENAVKAARTAFKTWRDVTSEDRAVLLNKLGDLILKNAEELGSLETIAMGVPKMIASKVVEWGAAEFKYYAGLAGKIHGEVIPGEGKGMVNMISYEPLGVCAAVAPWNGSLLSFGWKVAPALAAGNTVVFKGSEKSPLGLLELAKLVAEAGFPPGVINILTGDGRVGAILSSHMDVNKIAFTGSTATGRKVQAAAAQSNLKRVTLELGGKSAAIVFDDADLDKAVTQAMIGVIGNSGQICVAGTRILVQEKIADVFVQRLTEAFAGASQGLGDPSLDTTMLGPLADKMQFERVMGFLEKAKEDKLQIVAGGGRHGDKGYFVQPTLILNPAKTHTVYKDEIFGPVGVITTFKTEEEAIEIANDTQYGLGAMIYGKDISRVMRVAGRLDAGSVSVNNPVQIQVGVPFGGWKQSGYGKEGGIDGMKAYMQGKTIQIPIAP